MTLSRGSDATRLDLDGEGGSATHIVKVANLILDTSGPGFSASISSGNLVKPTGTRPVPYQVALVDEGAAPPPAAAFTVASGMRTSYTTTSAGAVHKDLYILYRSAALQDPGAYSASIDVDIVDR